MRALLLPGLGSLSPRYLLHLNKAKSFRRKSFIVKVIHCHGHENYARMTLDLPKSSCKKERDDLSRTANSWITQLDGRMVFGTADGTFDHNV